MEIKSKKLEKLLIKKKEINEKGLPLFDQIQGIVTKVIESNMGRIATDMELWKFIKPYIDEKEYKKANGELGEVYRQLQKLEYDMGRIKEKVTAEIDKEKIELGEFEELGSVKLEGCKITIDIVDKIEEYKELLREKNANKSN